MPRQAKKENHRDRYQSDNRETNDKTKPFRNNLVTKTLLVFGKFYNHKGNKIKLDWTLDYRPWTLDSCGVQGPESIPGFSLYSTTR